MRRVLSRSRRYRNNRHIYRWNAVIPVIGSRCRPSRVSGGYDKPFIRRLLAKEWRRKPVVAALELAPDAVDIVAYGDQGRAVELQ